MLNIAHLAMHALASLETAAWIWPDEDCLRLVLQDSSSLWLPCFFEAMLALRSSFLDCALSDLSILSQEKPPRACRALT